MRVLLFTGKGGVGKTTVAAATAVRAAQAGHRTIIMSTDPAHSLGDSFDMEIGSSATPVTENLWAEQIDAQERLEENWREIQEYFIQLMNWAGVDTIQAEELSVIPGLDEIFALIDVKRYVDGGNHDLLVVDCAPTAMDTLSREDPIRIRNRGPSSVLPMRLPFVSRDELNARRRGDELFVKV